MKYCIVHSNRAAKRGSLNGIPNDQNEMKPEVAPSSLRRKNTSDGRAPGVGSGDKK